MTEIGQEFHTGSVHHGVNVMKMNDEVFSKIIFMHNWTHGKLKTK